MALPTNRLETLLGHLMCSYLQHSNAVAFLGQDVSKHYESIGLIDVLPLELPRFARPVGVAWSSQSAVANRRTAAQVSGASVFPPRVRNIRGEPRRSKAAVAPDDGETGARNPGQTTARSGRSQERVAHSSPDVYYWTVIRPAVFFIGRF